MNKAKVSSKDSFLNFSEQVSANNALVIHALGFPSGSMTYLFKGFWFESSFGFFSNDSAFSTGGMAQRRFRLLL